MEEVFFTPRIIKIIQVGTISSKSRNRSQTRERNRVSGADSMPQINHSTPTPNTIQRVSRRGRGKAKVEMKAEFAANQNNGVSELSCYCMFAVSRVKDTQIDRLRVAPLVVRDVDSSFEFSTTSAFLIRLSSRYFSELYSCRSPEDLSPLTIHSI